ncbi:hypothetical protein GF343_03000 [Candidatus Woesearchaeota archaeon]|nr:hypothetical protein [Candidatus Woesearchaeota archaeon]
MSDNLPEVSKSSEKLWDAVFSAVKLGSEPVYAKLETHPIKDDVFQGLAAAPGGRVVKEDRHAADRFVLYVKSGEKGKEHPDYFGNGERVRDEHSAAGFGYSPETMKKLCHEVGLRLSRLYSLEREVNFTGEILGAQDKEVTEEFISGLLSSGRKELGFIEVKLLGD